jgi:hypothetical protein
MIYLVEAVGVGRVKIGYTSGDARDRLAALQTGSPVPLRIVATMEGGPGLERTLHAAFEVHRLHGEWFEDVLVIRERFSAAPGGDRGAARDRARIADIKAGRSPSTDPGELDRLRASVIRHWCALMGVELARGKQPPCIHALLDSRHRCGDFGRCGPGAGGHDDLWLGSEVGIPVLFTAQQYGGRVPVLNAWADALEAFAADHGLEHRRFEPGDGNPGWSNPGGRTFVVVARPGWLAPLDPFPPAAERRTA